MLDYIKRRQKQWEEKIKRAAELEAEKEAARVVETPDTEVESESSENEEDTARKKILLEQQEQEAERLRQDSERIRSEDWAAMSEWLRDNQKQHAATIEARKEAARVAELEAKKEAARVAKMEAEARKQKQITERKNLLLEQQEAERLRQKHVQRKEEIAKQKWNEQVNTLVTQIKARAEKDKKLEEIRVIIKHREPSLQELDWISWLSDPLNQRLADLDFAFAMEIFKRDNLMAKLRKKTHGKSRKRNLNYALSFTGNDEHNQSGRDDTARVDLVATQFTPNDPTNKGFDEGSGRKPLAESGFTVSYWWRPDENYVDSFPIGWKRDSSGRFEFGLKNTTKPYFSIGGSELKNTTWADMFDESGNSGLKNTLLDNGEGTAPGSGNKLILNKWYHIVATYAGTDNVDGDGNYLRKIYLNGYHIYGGFGEGKQSVNWTSNTAARMTKGLAFGMRAVLASGTDSELGIRNTKYNNGNACALSEIAIYSEEKNAAWASSVYDAGSGYNHKNSGGDGLVAYWKLDEGSGTTAKDSGPYGWNGTLTNAAHGNSMDGSADNSSQIEGINARFPDAKPTWTTHPVGYDQ